MRRRAAVPVRMLGGTLEVDDVPGVSVVLRGVVGERQIMRSRTNRGAWWIPARHTTAAIDALTGAGFIVEPTL